VSKDLEVPVAWSVRLDLKGSEDGLDVMGNEASLDQLDRRANQGFKVFLDYQETKETEATRVTLDPRELKGHEGCLARTDLQAWPEYLERWGPEDSLDLEDSTVYLDLLAYPAQREGRDQKEMKDQMDRQDHLDLLDRRDPLDLLDQLDPWDPLDRLGRVGSQDFLVCQGLMGYPATTGILEDLDQKETRVLKDTPDLLASQAPGESKETLAKGDNKGTRETKEKLGWRGKKVTWG